MKEPLCKKGTATIRINSEPPKPTTFEDLGYVQVVRCNDCKHGSLYCTEDVCGETLIECNRPDLGDVIEIHGWKWFCADGERK